MSNLFKEKNYNESLRSSILICSIREEEAASEVVKSLLRIVKPESKTLNNKSSSLSFKNKIDLLYDIDDLNKNEYSNLVKFMEIRNQFIHNPNCNSFKNLKTEASEQYNYLRSNFRNNLEDEEASLNESFKSLFITTMGKLLLLNIEYQKGYRDEWMRYINSKTLERFDDILESANLIWKESKVKNPTVQSLLPYFTNSEQDVKSFEAHLKTAMLGIQIEIADSIINGEVTEADIYKRRTELIKALKDERDTYNKHTET